MAAMAVTMGAAMEVLPHEGVAIVRGDAQDEGAGGSDIHAARAEVGALIQFAVKHQVGYGYHVVKREGRRGKWGGVYAIADCVVIPVARGYNEKHSGVADSCLEFFGAVLGAEAQIAYLAPLASAYLMAAITLSVNPFPSSPPRAFTGMIFT